MTRSIWHCRYTWTGRCKVSVIYIPVAQHIQCLSHQLSCMLGMVDPLETNKTGQFTTLICQMCHLDKSLQLCISQRVIVTSKTCCNLLKHHSTHPRPTATNVRLKSLTCQIHSSKLLQPFLFESHSNQLKLQVQKRCPVKGGFHTPKASDPNSQHTSWHPRVSVSMPNRFPIPKVH